MKPRVRNLVLSLIAGFAVLLSAAFIALLTGAITADYLRTAIMMFAVVVICIVIIIVVSFNDDDSADKAWVGGVYGLMAALSLAAGLGIVTKLFASELLAKNILLVITGFDALVTTGYWFYSSFFNDDFVS